MSNPIYVDKASGLARVRGNEKLYNRMLGLLLKSTEFDAFEEQIAANDTAKASESAHAIKGMCANLSLLALADISEKLMVDLRSGIVNEDDLATFRTAVAETKSIVTDMLA